MKRRKYKYLVGDFETTVYEGQKFTEVWASACVELFTEDVKIFGNISDTFNYLKSLKENICIYYHNLKFDGSFWLSFLLKDLKLKQAYIKTGETIKWLEDKDMPRNSFKYSISAKGQWYTITIKLDTVFIQIRDSLKLLPFSVKRIGESFKTKHRKLEMEYKGLRYANCYISDEEKHYIANDVLVVKEAIEIMFRENHNKLTIGSCCLSEFKTDFTKNEYKFLFPNVYDIELDDCHNYKTAGEYILKSYRGGWCYLAKGKENKKKLNGCTLDVNSLYPSMMHSVSGNYYPIGEPTFWFGNYIPVQATSNNRYYFIRIKTRFYLKPLKLPFIQLKGSWLYRGNEMLETSDIYDKETGRYYSRYIGVDGGVKDTRVEMTLTMTDYKLLKDHYDLVDFEIIDGCYFDTEIGIFDHYIDRYKKLKMESTGALRELAKLFLNNLYGKMASTIDSSFKVAVLKEDGVIGFIEVKESDKIPGYIPIGSAITSYARNFTIRAAQANYYGPDNPGFCYADTDSIHCDIPAESIKGVRIDSKEFCCWKPESSWDYALFVRQKTYVEHITHENLKPIDSPYFNVKCAGMPDKCKDLFIKNITNYQITEEDKEKYTEEEIKFIQSGLTLNDFGVGLVVPGKLRPKRILGGIVLEDTYYTMRPA